MCAVIASTLCSGVNLVTSSVKVPGNLGSSTAWWRLLWIASAGSMHLSMAARSCRDRFEHGLTDLGGLTPDRIRQGRHAVRIDETKNRVVDPVIIGPMHFVRCASACLFMNGLDVNAITGKKEPRRNGVW